MVSQTDVSAALASLTEAELQRLCRICDRSRADNPTHRARDTHRSVRPGMGREFMELRPYCVGDDPRYIDWRSSLRSSHLLVRQNFDDKTSCKMICLDRSASMGLDKAKWLAAVRMAAALAYVLLQRHAPVGLVTFSDQLDGHFPPAFGDKQYLTLFAKLAATLPMNQGGGSLLTACLPALPRRSQAIIISDFLAPDAMLKELDILSRSGLSLHVIQVLSDDEALTSDGVTVPCMLRDIESGQLRLVDCGPAARVKVHQSLAHLTQELRRACLRRDITYAGATASVPWFVPVSHLLTGMGRRHA